MAEQFLSTKPYKGTRDFYPEDMRLRHWVFSKMREVVSTFGYQEYDGPELEPFELYAAKTGEEIVNQQLYWFIDRGERKVAIRPEMTPTLARMVAARVHELPKPIRWFSFPNLWRYERPQRGRLREHWQLNVDVLGGDPLLADTEVLLLSLEILKAFKGENFISIRVNNRKLVDFFFTKSLGLAADTALQLTKAIDARAKIGEEAYAKWLEELGIKGDQKSKMEAFFHAPLSEIQKNFSCQGADELAHLFRYLEESGAGASVQFDPTVMRGMNYYTGTVFEMYDVSPENRRAMFGGGRYDNLIGLFGKTQLSGVGFGMGDVTFQDFLEVHKLLPEWGSFVDVFVSLPKPELRALAETVASQLRARKLGVITPLEAGGFGAQLKMASKHGARFAVLFGEEELKQNAVLLKDLTTGTQKTIEISKLAEVLSK